jgi:hypothetical protein
MMRDVSTGGISAGSCGVDVDWELCPPPSSSPGVAGVNSASSRLGSSSEVSSAGKGIALSMTAMHLAMGHRGASCAGGGRSEEES